MLDPQVVAVVALVVAVLALFVAAVLYWRLRQTRARYRALLTGVDGADLEQLLNDHIRRVDELQGVVDALSRQMDVLEARLPRALQRVGVVRFNPFDDVGGDQSFAIALLDEHGSGLVLSGLYAREKVRVYAKAVEEGRSPYPLTAEERQAIEQALGQPPDRGSRVES